MSPVSHSFASPSIIGRELPEDEDEMSLLILSFDRSSDRIAEYLSEQLNAPTKDPRVASFCSSTELFSSPHEDWEKIFHQVLKHASLSHNDLLGFLVLIDIATTNRLHLAQLSRIRSLLLFLNAQHPFQSILTFILHAHPHNQLYTSALTCFNLLLLLLHLYPWVQGILFHSIDAIDDPHLAHQTVADQLASIFLPVSSLREDSLRTNRSVCVEFLQLIQHLLIDPTRKLLVVLVEANVKKSLQQPFQSALLIQRGHQAALQIIESKAKNLDQWNSLEKRSRSIVILNSFELTRDLLTELVLEPCQRKLLNRQAYLFWLRKKFDTIDDLDAQLTRGIELCRKILRLSKNEK